MLWSSRESPIWLPCKARAASLRTFIAPQDIANMALFVTSDAGARISGQELVVDGHTETF